MDVWIPERSGREAIGELPYGVSLNVVPPDEELPQAILEAEFLVSTRRAVRSSIPRRCSRSFATGTSEPRST